MCHHFFRPPVQAKYSQQRLGATPPGKLRPSEPEESEPGESHGPLEPAYFASFRLLQSTAFLLGIGAIAAFHAQADEQGFPDIRFGPYVYNEIHVGASPVGEEGVLPMGSYHLQFGWIEPISLDSKSSFACTYLETDGHFDVSPYQTDLGTTFSIKPFRLFEFGLTYNRLIFNESLVSFGYDPQGRLPEASSWSAGKVLKHQPGDGVGADVFTFTGAVHMQLEPVTLVLEASSSFWDIDIIDNDLVYEYDSDLLIAKRERIQRLSGDLSFELPRMQLLLPFTVHAITLQDRYIYATHTQLEKNLIAFGLSGFRYGKDSPSQRRGLDFKAGYFTHHPQLEGASFGRRIYLSLDWKWNIDFLSASRF